MKQPELGRRMADLRKSRGLTQEELVEKCNISVRTIQRIETGEVTPRMYTVKTILENLEYDMDQLYDDAPPPVTNALNLGWIAGIVYFIAGFPEAYLEAQWLDNEGLFGFFNGASGFGLAESFNPYWYIIIKAITLAAFIIFMRGFYTTGRIYGHSLLRISSIFLVIALSFTFIYDIASLYVGGEERLFVLPGISITFGILGILFAASLFQISKKLGVICLAAGLMEAFAAIFFLMLLPIGFLFLIPAEVFEIVILYKAYRTFSPEKDPFQKVAYSEQV